MIYKKMLQVNHSGVYFSETAANMKRLRRQFDRFHFLHFPGFLPKPVLKMLQERIRRASFFKKDHKGIANEFCMRDHDAFRFLQFTMNDASFFHWIEAVTGCPPIGCFMGRVYRKLPGIHHDSWHNDMGKARLVAMSVNLSENPYQEGHLLLRQAGKTETERIIPNTGPGDALFFHLSHDLEHRVQDIEGKFPKTAYAGWYCSEPDFFDTVKKIKKKKTKVLTSH